MLVSIMNSTLEYSLNKMLENSAEALTRLAKRFLLTLAADREHQRRIDYLLSLNTYIMKCEALVESGRMPVNLDYCFHPRFLYCRHNSDFRRRLMLIKSYVVYYVKMLQKSRMGLR